MFNNLTLDRVKELAINDQNTSFVAFCSEGQTIQTLPLDFESSEHKNVLMGVLRVAVQELRMIVDEVWLVAEAWAAITIGKDVESAVEARARLPKNLADAPGRREILICQQEKRGEPLSLDVFEIERAESGRICALKPLPKDYSNMENNLWVMENPLQREKKH